MCVCETEIVCVCVRERKCVCVCAREISKDCLYLREREVSEKEREIKRERSSELLCVRERKSGVCLIEEEYVCKIDRVSICV